MSTRSRSRRVFPRPLAELLEGRVLLDHSPDHADPRELVAVGSSVLFSMQDVAFGRELWATDGTASGPVLVKDIRPGPDASNPQSFRSLGQVAYFTADDGAHGRELWRSDGTEPGTRLVADLTPGQAGSTITDMIVMDGDLYCAVDRGTSVPEIHRVAGASGSVSRLPDGEPPVAWLRMPKVNGLGYEFLGGILYSVDPTGGQETFVYDPGLSSGRMFYGAPVAAGGRLFLPTVDGSLYVSDGTTAGTRPVPTAPEGRVPVNNWIAGSDGRLYFASATGTPPSLGPIDIWSSDGTDAGTHVVASVPGDIPIQLLAYDGGRVYFLDGGRLNAADVATGEVDAVPITESITAVQPLAFLGGNVVYASTLHDDVRAALPGVEPAPSLHLASARLPDGSQAILRAEVRGGEAGGLAIAWDLDADGAFDDATGAEVTVAAAELARLTAGGPAFVRARADDGAGNFITSRSARLEVFGEPPAAALTATYTYAQNGDVEFAVRFTDPSGVDAATLVGDDAAVTARLGDETTPDVPLAVRFVGIDDPAPGPQRTVRYRASLPLGSVIGPATRLTVAPTPGQVRDLLGNANDGTILGAPLRVYELPADVSVTPPTVPPNVQGSLVNVFGVDGREATTPLASRRVWADADDDGVFDPGESNALTDLDGRFAFYAQPGTVLRAGLSGDWAPAAGSAASLPVTLAPNAQDLRFALAAPAVVDVLLAVTGGFGPTDFADMPAVRERARSLIVDANRYYANSETNVVLDLAGVLPVWYRSTGRATRDLAKLRNGRDGTLDEVQAERDRVGADVAVLVAAGPALGGVVGIAPLLIRPTGDPSLGYACIRDFDAPTLAHELGHLMGAGHERAEDRFGATDYAHGWVFHPPPPGQPLKDVMAYGNGLETELPFFSNPALTYNGVPIGDARTADNARVIREFGPAVAAYRGRPAGGPAGDAPALDLTGAWEGRLPPATAPGATLNVGVRVTNAGAASALESMGFELFISADAVLDPLDTSVGGTEKLLVNLPAGKSKRLRARLNVPVLPPGTYFVFARVHGGPAGAEPNTANNVAAGPSIQVS